MEYVYGYGYYYYMYMKEVCPPHSDESVLNLIQFFPFCQQFIPTTNQHICLRVLEFLDRYDLKKKRSSFAYCRTLHILGCISGWYGWWKKARKKKGRWSRSSNMGACIIPYMQNNRKPVLMLTKLTFKSISPVISPTGLLVQLLKERVKADCSPGLNLIESTRLCLIRVIKGEL